MARGCYGIAFSFTLLGLMRCCLRLLSPPGLFPSHHTYDLFPFLTQPGMQLALFGSQSRYRFIGSHWLSLPPYNGPSAIGSLSSFQAWTDPISGRIFHAWFTRLLVLKMEAIRSSETSGSLRILWRCRSQETVLSIFKSKTVRTLVLKLNSVALVRERTMTTKRPPLVGEVVPTFADRGCCVVSATDSHGR
jgi:hypothetical protein